MNQSTIVNQIAFASLPDVRNGLDKLRLDAKLGGFPLESIEFPRGLLSLVVTTLTDGSKVARVIINVLED